MKLLNNLKSFYFTIITCGVSPFDKTLPVHLLRRTSWHQHLKKVTIKDLADNRSRYHGLISSKHPGYIRHCNEVKTLSLDRHAITTDGYNYHFRDFGGTLVWNSISKLSMRSPISRSAPNNRLVNIKGYCRCNRPWTWKCGCYSVGLTNAVRT